MSSSSSYAGKTNNFSRGGGNNGRSYGGGNRNYNSEVRVNSIEAAQNVLREQLRQNVNYKFSEFLQNKSIKRLCELDSSAIGILSDYCDSTRKQFIHHLERCNQAAKEWRNVGYYTWAEQWEAYAKNPDGPHPQCLHKDLLDGQFTRVDKEGHTHVNYDAYQHLLNRGKKFAGREPTLGSGNCRFVERKDERSNAELGKVREIDPKKKDGKEHPMQLIAKLNKLRKAYPEYYRRDETYLTSN